VKRRNPSGPHRVRLQPVRREKGAQKKSSALPLHKEAVDASGRNQGKRNRSQITDE